MVRSDFEVSQFFRPIRLPGIPSTPSTYEIGAVAGSSFCKTLPARNRIFLPPWVGKGDVTLAESIDAGVHDCVHGASFHYCSDLDRRGVRWAGVHPPARVRVQRQLDTAEQTRRRRAASLRQVRRLAATGAEFAGFVSPAILSSLVGRPQSDTR